MLTYRHAGLRRFAKSNPVCEGSAGALIASACHAAQINSLPAWLVSMMYVEVFAAAYVCGRRLRLRNLEGVETQFDLY